MGVAVRSSFTKGLKPLDVGEGVALDPEAEGAGAMSAPKVEGDSGTSLSKSAPIRRERWSERRGMGAACKSGPGWPRLSWEGRVGKAGERVCGSGLMGVLAREKRARCRGHRSMGRCRDEPVGTDSEN